MYLCRYSFSQVPTCVVLFTGCFGVHIAIRSNDQISLELYGRLGFVDLHPGLSSSYVILGRSF